MQRRQLLTGWTALFVLAQVASAVAQTYPSRPIRQIVPYASGSAADAISCSALNGDGVSASASKRWEARKPGTVCRFAMLRR